MNEPDAAGRLADMTDIRATCGLCGRRWFGRVPAPDGKDAITWTHECLGPVLCEFIVTAGGEGT
jgi:hypothetical protein